MDLNKIPRWALIILSLAGLSSMGVLVSTARADLDRFKSIAYQAKNISDSNSDAINRLEANVEKIHITQETFRKEYRDDRIRDAQQLQAMEERIIRAMKK